MKKFILFVLLSFSAIVSVVHSQIRVEGKKTSITREEASTLDMQLSNYSVFVLKEKINPVNLNAKEISLSINLANTFQSTLDVEDNSALIAGPLSLNSIKLFKSIHLENSTRLSVYNGMINAVIEENNERFYVVPISSFMPSDNSNRIVFYKEKDIKKRNRQNLKSLQSKVKFTPTINRERYSDFTKKLRIIRIAVHADYEYNRTYGNNTLYRMIDLINQSEGIYQKTFNIRFVITYSGSFRSINEDKYTYDSTKIDLDRGAIFLNSISSYWSRNSTDGRNRDILLVFSGRKFGIVAGMAKPGGMSCDYNKSRMNNYAFIANDKSYATIHEIGHLLGAKDEENNSIMGYGDSSFSTSSINDITSHMSKLSCIKSETVPTIEISGSREVKPGTEQFYTAQTLYNDPNLTYKWSIQGVPFYTLYPGNKISIRFPNVNTYYALSCRAEKTIYYEGKSFILDHQAFMTVGVSNFYPRGRYLITQNDKSVIISEVRADNTLVPQKGNNKILYQLNHILTGKLVDKGSLSTEEGNIDISNLSKGIYVITITTKEGNKSSYKLSIN